VRNKSAWERVCGLTRTVVEGLDFDDDAHAIVVSVRPVARARNRCGLCGRRAPDYDLGEGRRRWALCSRCWRRFRKRPRQAPTWPAS
jgi:hypothetical protein